MEELDAFRLDGAETTLVFAWTDGPPALLYQGAMLPTSIDLGTLVSCFQRPLPHATLDVNEPVSLHPEAERGFPGHPALIGHRPTSARGWAGRFRHPQLERRDDGVIFRLIDEARGLWLELDCRLDQDTDVATFRSRLGNRADTPFVIDWLTVPVLAPAQLYSEQISFHGRWCAEFGMTRSPVLPGAMVRENRRSRTSHDAFPGIILLTPETGEETGACLGCHFGWSGNHRLLQERLPTGDVQLQMGCLLLSQEGLLEPGEVMETPPLYVARSDCGLNALSQKFHDHVRRRLLQFPAANRPRPVTVNTWEAIYFDHRHEKLTALADAAADIGAERFVLDDGWFRGRRDDATGLGDWYPDEAIYPDGLGPIVDYVRARGMQFGLWVEPEMVSPNSDLFRRHPDWALGVEPYPKIIGRNQLVLDIARPEVADYLFERLAELVGNHAIDYLKWDMNRDLALPGNEEGEAAAASQVIALYRLIDRLLEAFPSLEIESCASGGGRIDYGILERTHRFWVSDSNDAVERFRIQDGFSHFFPPEVMGAHVGPAWSHTSGRGLHTGLRVLAAGYGHMGIEADLTRMSDADREIVRDAVARYKADRAIWHEGRLRRIKTVDPGLIGMLAVSPERTRARMIMAQIDRPRSSLPPRMPILGLEPERAYRVSLQFASEQVEKANRRFDNPLWSDGCVMMGDVLAMIGIGLPALYAQTGLAIAIDAAD
ncbi:MAG: alpha-galactosidase [Alphaproteobacteria bacterium]